MIKTLGDLMDVMNRDYDRNDPKFLKPIQLSVYNQSHVIGRADVVERVKNNIVTNPETIGLDKDNKCLDGMEQEMEMLDREYANQNVEARTR